MRLISSVLLFLVLAFASAKVETSDYVDAQIVEDPSRFASLDSSLEAETETETESATTTDVELVSQEAQDISVQMDDSASVIVEAEDALAADEDPSDPRVGLLTATFGKGKYADIKAIDLKMVPGIIDKVKGVTDKVKDKINLGPLLDKAKQIVEKIKVEELSGCYVISFLSTEEKTMWDVLNFPAWLVAALKHVPALSVCTSGGVAIRFVVQTNEVTNAFFTVKKGWVIAKTGGSDLTVSTRLGFAVNSKTNALQGVLTGEYTVPGTFKLTGDFTEGALTVRNLAKELGVDIPTTLPQPVAAVADTKITKVIVGVKSNTPYVVVLATTPAPITLSKFKIDNLYFGIMWACPSTTKLLELQGVVMSENAAVLVSQRASNKLVRMHQARAMTTERQEQTKYDYFTRSAFLQAAAQETVADAKCLSFMVQTKITVGKINIPLALFVDSKGVSLTLAGSVQTGGSTIIPDMENKVDAIKFTLNELALTVAGKDAWSGLAKAVTDFINEKTKILDTQIEVSRFNVIVANQFAVQLASSLTWMEKKASLNFFYGPADEKLAGPPAIAAVLSTDIDIASLFQKVLGLNIPYFVSKSVFVAISTYKLELKSGMHKHLGYLTNSQADLESGVQFNAGVALNPASDNIIIKKLASIFPGALNLNAAVNEKRVQVSVKLERIQLTARVAIVDLGITVASAYVPPSVTVTFSSGLEVKLKNQNLLFELAFSVQQTGPATTLELGLEMKTAWKDAFGVSGLVIDRPGGSFAITVASPPVLTGLSVKGALNIKDLLYGAIQIGLNFVDPEKDYFYGEMKEIDMCKILKAFLGKDTTVKAPELLCEAFKWPAFIVAFSLTTQQVKLETVSMQTIKPGFYFKGAIPMPLFNIGIETQLVMPPLSPELHATIDVPPINFPPYLVVSRSEKETDKGPLGKIDVTTNIKDFKVELKAYAKVFNAIGGGVSLTMSVADGFELDAFFVATLGTVQFRTELAAHFDPKNPIFKTAVALKIELVDFFKVQEKIKGAIQSFGSALKSASDKIEAAAKTIGDKCNPEAMCAFSCPAPSFLETKARLGADLALYQRAQMLDKHLKAALAQMQQLRRQHAEEMSELVAKEEAGEGPQLLIQTEQRQMRELADSWRDSVDALIEEMDAIRLGVHDYHDLQSLPAHQRMEADAKLAAEHNAAVEAAAARFASLELELDENNEFTLALREAGIFDKIKSIASTVGSSISNAAVAVGNGISNVASAVGTGISNGVGALTEAVKNGASAIQNQFEKIKGTLCRGAIRVCSGACKAAQAVVGGVADLTDLAGDGVNKVAELATLIEFKRIGFSVSIGNPTGISLDLEYRFGLSKDQTWKTKSWALQTPPFDGPNLDVVGFGKKIWERIAGDVVKEHVNAPLGIVEPPKKKL